MQWRLSTIVLFLWLGFFTMAVAKETPLKAKIGQMLMMGFKGTELHPNDTIVQAILAQQLGGVILFDYDYQTKMFDRNIKNPAQLKHLTTQLQQVANQAAIQHGNNHLTPLFIGIDYEGGQVNRLKENNGFPKTYSAADMGKGTLKETMQYATRMAKTLKEEGINVNFAPVLDVNINPDNPVIAKLGRSFSSDPKKVIDYAEIFSKAYQEQGIICAYKHFPGHGSSTGDTHAGFVDITHTWKKEELTPYKKLLQKSFHCSMVMTSHVVHEKLDHNSYPASLSSAITTGLLRKKLHFNGVIITDDLQMGAITKNYSVSEAVILAINAGADILIFGNQLVSTPEDPKHIIDLIYHDVMTGKISQSRIDEAYQHIMQLKKHIS